MTAGDLTTERDFPKIDSGQAGKKATVSRTKPERPRGNRPTTPFIGSVALLLALALPGAANAYWACVSYGGPHGTCWEWCDEYDDCTHEATGRWRFTVSSDSC